MIWPSDSGEPEQAPTGCDGRPPPQIQLAVQMGVEFSSPAMSVAPIFWLFILPSANGASRLGAVRFFTEAENKSRLSWHQLRHDIRRIGAAGRWTTVRANCPRRYLPTAWHPRSLFWCTAIDRGTYCNNRRRSHTVYPTAAFSSFQKGRSASNRIGCYLE